jgi:hypothetical protein
MPVTPQDRPLESLRDDTVDQLIMNYGHGHLSLEAFQRRLDQAFEATSHDALVALTADLDLEVDASYVERKKAEFENGSGRRDDVEDEDDVEWIVDVFSGSDRGGAWEVPQELRVIDVFGGTDIDMSDARFTSRVTRIRLFCLFGGVNIYVPEGVSTTVKAFSIFGGFTNKAPSIARPEGPRLIIEGLIIFGGGDVKVRRSLRERALEFADSLRAMFSGGPTGGTSPRRGD